MARTAWRFVLDERGAQFGIKRRRLRSVRSFPYQSSVSVEFGGANSQRRTRTKLRFSRWVETCCTLRAMGIDHLGLGVPDVEASV